MDLNYEFGHYGNIVENAYARVGENCNLQGDGCIGNNGLIADNVTIGAGAIVIKSCT